MILRNSAGSSCITSAAFFRLITLATKAPSKNRKFPFCSTPLNNRLSKFCIHKFFLINMSDSFCKSA